MIHTLILLLGVFFVSLASTRIDRLVDDNFAASPTHDSSCLLQQKVSIAKTSEEGENNINAVRLKDLPNMKNAWEEKSAAHSGHKRTLMTNLPTFKRWYRWHEGKTAVAFKQRFNMGFLFYQWCHGGSPTFWAGFQLHVVLCAALVGFWPCCTLLMKTLVRITNNLVGRVETTRAEDMANHEHSDGVLHSLVLVLDMGAKENLQDVLLTCRPEAHIWRPAIIGREVAHRWSIAELTRLMEHESWASLSKESCVVLSMPSGPILAVSLICTMARTRCAPIDPYLSQTEATLTMQRVEGSALLCQSCCSNAILNAAAEVGLRVVSVSLGAEPQPCLSGVVQKNDSFSWCKMHDVALVLCTSGTTGKSKVVPMTMGQLIKGARSIAATMTLGEYDVCLNALPLFHIGGLSCNLLASLISGGAVFCSERRFTPEDFIDQVSAKPSPTWYYAVPSMHLALVELGAALAGNDKPVAHNLRMCRNAGAVLPSALQQRLEGLWRCKIFATYGMTECMPIASPVLQPNGDCSYPLGSVGKSVGPVIEVRGGEVLIRGDLVTRGYLGLESGWLPDGLFPTGDLGRVDAEGHLWLVGRSKEAINRGGETISPQEVEDTLESNDFLQDVAAFSVPHDRLGEAIGLALVIRNVNFANETLSLVLRVLEGFSCSHQPSVVVIMDQLPRTHNGKIKRNAIGQLLAERCELRNLSGWEDKAVILDTRGSDASHSRCTFLTPEPGSLGEMFSSSEADSARPIDSLGLMCNGSPRVKFETKVICQIYLFHVIGVNVFHLTVNPAIPLNVDPVVFLGFVFFHAHSVRAHMSMFFSLMAYVDSKRLDGHLFQLRDLVMLCTLLVLKLTGYGSLPLGTAAVDFLGHVLAARLLVNAGYRIKAPPWLQTLLAYPCACLLLALSKASLGSQKDQNTMKWTTCITMYVISFAWLLKIVQLLQRWCPRTCRQQFFVGLISWCCFLAWTFATPLLMPLERPSETCWNEASGNKICIELPHPMEFPAIITRLVLMIITFALMPFTLFPEIVYRSLFGLLLAIPLFRPITLWILSLPLFLGNTLTQISGVATSFCIYFLIVGPILNSLLIVAMSVVKWIADQVSRAEIWGGADAMKS